MVGSAGITAKMVVMIMLLGLAVGAIGWAASGGLGKGSQPDQPPNAQPPTAKKQAIEKKKAPAATDLFGDPLPDGASVRLGTTRLRHNANIWGVAFSPDSKILASIAYDEAIRLWNAMTGELIQELRVPLREPTLCVAFSPDGSKLASGGIRGNVRLWDVQTGKMLFEKKGHGTEVLGLAFAPDGESFASAGGDLQIWNVATGAGIHNFHPPGRNSNVRQGVAFSPDGKLLAASRGVDIHVWDTRTWTSRLVLPKAYLRVEIGLVFKDNATLISDERGRVSFWDVTKGKQIREMNLGRGVFGGATLSSNGKLLVASQADKIAVVDVATGKSIHEFSDYYNPFIGTANQLAISPDAKTLAARAGDHVIHIWDLTTGKRRLNFPDGHAARVRSSAFSPDACKALTGGDDGTARLWDASTGKELRVYSLERKDAKIRVGGAVAAISPNGKWIAAGGYEDRQNAGNAGLCHVWDAATGKELIIQDFPDVVQSLTFAPDNKRLALATLGSRDQFGKTRNAVYIWDFATGSEMISVADQDGRCFAMAFSSTGKTLAWVDGESLHLWDMATKRQGTFPLPANTWNAAFSADGKSVVISEFSEKSSDRLFILEVVTGQVLRSIKVKNTFMNAVALSPDGRIVASCQAALGLINRDYDFSTIHLWDVETGLEVFQGQTGSSVLHDLAFSRDGQGLIAGMDNGTALIWSLKDIGPRRMRAVVPQELERLWDDLAGENAAKAHEAIWKLVAAPKQSVPYLHDKLKPIFLADQAKIQRWIADLTSDKFAVRQAAVKELGKIGQQVEPPVQKALKGNISLETRRRLELILRTLSDIPGPETLRTIRAIMALEQIGSSEARAVLEGLARGAPRARETEEAKASLERLTNRVHTP